MSFILKQSTASQDIVIGAFVDDTDFKTAETGLTIANTDVKLMKDGGASVDKNSGGGTHRVNGFYSLTLDATDTNTVGQLMISVKVAGALPVWLEGQVIEEAVFDLFYAASATGEVVLQGVTHTGAVVPTVTTLTGHTAQTGDSFARIGAPAGASVSADIADIPTVTEFNARTQPTADYFDPAADTVANVTTVATLTGHTAQTGDSFARIGAPVGASISADLADVPTVTEFNARTQPTADYFDPAADTVALVTTTTNLTTNNDKTGYALSTAGDQSVADLILPPTNTAFPDIEFLFVAASDHVTPVTGATGTSVTRSIDGSSFGAGTGTLAEVANGIYQYDASAADMNGKIITFRFIGTGGTPGAPDDTFVTVVTSK